MVVGVLMIVNMIRSFILQTFCLVSGYEPRSNADDCNDHLLNLFLDISDVIIWISGGGECRCWGRATL